MAISDTLHDAAEAIEDYLANLPEAYSDVECELRTIIADMRRIQTKLDKPPGLVEH